MRSFRLAREGVFLPSSCSLSSFASSLPCHLSSNPAKQKKEETHLPRGGGSPESGSALVRTPGSAAADLPCSSRHRGCTPHQLGIPRKTALGRRAWREGAGIVSLRDEEVREPARCVATRRRQMPAFCATRKRRMPCRCAATLMSERILMSPRGG
jgi:hypothetical protein